MKRIRTVAVFPTMFTLGNLVCGFFAIVVSARIERPTSADVPVAQALNLQNPTKLISPFDPADDTHNCMFSGWLIFLAMIFDALDGYVARMSRATSDFGAQLDSLCDLVTFGVAPAFLLVKMCPSFTYAHSQGVWILAAAYMACAALRLARFNVETDADDDHLHFNGLPSPAAAAAIAGFAILFYELRRDGSTLGYAAQADQFFQWALPVFALVVALLMVSRIPYPHVVNQMFRGQRSFGHIVGLVFAIGAVMAIHGYSVPIIVCAFVLASPIKFFYQRIRDRGREHEPVFELPGQRVTMFTGLVECLASVAQVVAEPPGRRIVVQAGTLAAEATIGESIAVSGCCLTVVAVDGEALAFEAGPETLARTTLGSLSAGSLVNLERSLRLSDRLGGHLVSGHIDGVGRVHSRIDEGDWSTVWFEAPAALLRQMAPKGSVAVDGVSLTLVEVLADRFSVALIPHTLAVTTLGRLTPGDAVNLETDILAKYVERQLTGGRVD